MQKELEKLDDFGNRKEMLKDYLKVELEKVDQLTTIPKLKKYLHDQGHSVEPYEMK